MPDILEPTAGILHPIRGKLGLPDCAGVSKWNIFLPIFQVRQPASWWPKQVSLRDFVPGGGRPWLGEFVQTESFLGAFR